MRKTDNKIFLFTGSVPYSSATEDTFLDPELPHLHSFFNSIIIIPKSIEGTIIKTPDYVQIDTSLTDALNPIKHYLLKFYKIFISVTSILFYKEIFTKPKQMLNLSSILRSIGFFGNALITKNWIDNYIKNNNIDLSNTIFYTYWLDEITLGICLAKQKYPKIKIISRAHGADLYEERHLPPYIPYRPEIFNLLDRVFTDSQAGRTYLITRYPLHKSLFEISCLGVSKQDFITEPSNDSIFRIVSCSNLVPIKRIDLLIRGLVELGMLRPHQIFDWVHIGGEPLRLELEQAARILLPQNIKYHFLGYLPKGGVISFYQNNKVDVFINVSSSEGTPVSVMEAQSCSIPVIATAVGGNSEIVTSDNGLLLTENPKADEIANAICFLLKDRNLIQDKKKKSYENWDKNYNSEKNLPSFATDLINILKNNKNRREKET